MRYALTLLVLLAGPVYGQKNPGPRYTAMGAGGVALQDAWSSQQNPAGITGSKRAVLAMAYQQHFMDPGLSTQTALFIFPYRQHTIGGSIERYGLSGYAEQNAGLAYARRFGDSFGLAIGIRYHQLSVVNYGSAGAITVDAGFQLHVTDKFIIGSHIVNPARSRFEDISGSALPVKLSVGASYKFSDRLLISTDLRKILNYSLEVMTGMEYCPVKWFLLRGGLSTNPFRQYTGFGLNHNKVRVDVAMAYHPHLAYSPQISFGYEF